MNKNIIPRLSNDIEYYPINQDEFFIHQIEFDHRIKISFELYQFLQLIDNYSDLADIVKKYNESYNSKLTIEFAYDFLYKKLARYGIIESNEIEIKPNEKPNYLKLSFIVISEQTVSKVTKYLRFLFLPNVMKKVILVSSVIILFSFYQFHTQIFYSGIQKTEWLQLFLLAFLGVTFHEFGHASAAHYFGAKHGGIGGGFYLFMPVYFADVTDIWRLQKHQRIVVNLAGMYFEFIYTMLLILTGIIFKNNLIVIIASIYSLTILRNLNPFIRSDGYWVLSDAIEKPNMMSHSFQRVKNIFKSKNNWKKIDYFLLVYGLISYSFILFFLYFVLILNPNSILYFHRNVYNFINAIFTPNSQISIADFGKLLVPFFFFYMVFGFIKKIVSQRVLKKHIA
jgi:putative peptide zinc metalloprotease protein